MSVHITEESRFHAWSAKPEPMRNELDARTILEQPTTKSYVYLWNSSNETSEWLEFDGEPMDIRR